MGRQTVIHRLALSRDHEAPFADHFIKYVKEKYGSFPLAYDEEDNTLSVDGKTSDVQIYLDPHDFILIILEASKTQGSIRGHFNYSDDQSGEGYYGVVYIFGDHAIHCILNQDVEVWCSIDKMYSFSQQKQMEESCKRTTPDRYVMTADSPMMYPKKKLLCGWVGEKGKKLKITDPSPALIKVIENEVSKNEEILSFRYCSKEKAYIFKNKEGIKNLRNYEFARYIHN